MAKLRPYPGAQAAFMASEPCPMRWNAKLGCYVEVAAKRNRKPAKPRNRQK